VLMVHLDLAQRNIELQLRTAADEVRITGGEIQALTLHRRRRQIVRIAGTQTVERYCSARCRTQSRRRDRWCDREAQRCRRG